MTEVRQLQSKNAASPMEVTEAGKVTEVRPLQAAKAPPPMEVAEAGMVTAPPAPAMWWFRLPHQYLPSCLVSTSPHPSIQRRTSAACHPFSESCSRCTR